jgi:hypothetical protein
MHEWGQGKLHSGSEDGPIVKDQDQALAIAYAEANASKKMAQGGGVEDETWIVIVEGMSVDSASSEEKANELAKKWKDEGYFPIVRKLIEFAQGGSMGWKHKMKTGGAQSYKDLERDLLKTFEKTGIAKKCYNGEIVVSGSGWSRPHPNGSISVTFWLMDKVPTDKLDKVAKEWAKKHDLIAATFYKNGIKDNADPVKNQDWRNEAAQSAKYIYGFTFYDDIYELKSVYTPLK